MNGLMTEREWRRQHARRSKARPDWWGAQMVIPCTARRGLRQDRAFCLFLLLLSCTVALLLPLFVKPALRETFLEASAAPHTPYAQPRSVSAISYQMPHALAWQEYTFTRSQLLRGKLLRLDEAHPLPQDAPPPNTFRIASDGDGMVPVASLGLKSGRETIEALRALFAELETRGVSGLAVWEGTVSAAQQRREQLKMLRQNMAMQSISESLAQVRSALDAPATGEMLQEYTVALRFRTATQQPDPLRPEQTAQGQQLLQWAWRYGFIRTQPDGPSTQPWRFRYVGLAHATAMTYLDLDFAQYLEWLHRQGQLVIHEGGRVKHIILCKPITGTHVRFDLPAGCTFEASLDNMGYAVVACTLP